MRFEPGLLSLDGTDFLLGDSSPSSSGYSFFQNSLFFIFKFSPFYTNLSSFVIILFLYNVVNRNRQTKQSNKPTGNKPNTNRKKKKIIPSCYVILIGFVFFRQFFFFGWLSSFIFWMWKTGEIRNVNFLSFFFRVFWCSLIGDSATSPVFSRIKRKELHFTFFWIFKIRDMCFNKNLEFCYMDVVVTKIRDSVTEVVFLKNFNGQRFW